MRLRRAVCRHDERAAVSTRLPLVLVECARCGQRRTLQLLGSWPLVWLAPGMATVDEHSLDELRAAYLVERAFGQVPPW